MIYLREYRWFRLGTCQYCTSVKSFHSLQAKKKMNVLLCWHFEVSFQCQVLKQVNSVQEEKGKWRQRTWSKRQERTMDTKKIASKYSAHWVNDSWRQRTWSKSAKTKTQWWRGERGVEGWRRGGKKCGKTYEKCKIKKIFFEKKKKKINKQTFWSAWSLWKLHPCYQWLTGNWNSSWPSSPPRQLFPGQWNPSWCV